MRLRYLPVLFLLLLPMSCGGEGKEPSSVSPLLSMSAPPSTEPSISGSPVSPDPAASPSFAFTDIEIVTTDDPVADVIWSIRFDAEWTGSGAPPEIRCGWRMYDENGDQNMLGVIGVTETDNILTQPVYPDEIAGRPVTARIVC